MSRGTTKVLSVSAGASGWPLSIRNFLTAVENPPRAAWGNAVATNCSSSASMGPVTSTSTAPLPASRTATPGVICNAAKVSGSAGTVYRKAGAAAEQSMLIQALLGGLDSLLGLLVLEAHGDELVGEGLSRLPELRLRDIGVGAIEGRRLPTLGVGHSHHATQELLDIRRALNARQRAEDI